MALVHEHFLKLPGSYLFSDIAKKVNTFKITHPKRDIIRLGIGDVTRPLPKACIEAMHKAVEEMTSAETFRGYGPEQGYDFLIEAIIKNDYAPRGIHLSPTEVFVNDGAKSDTGNIGDILRHDTESEKYLRKLRKNVSHLLRREERIRKRLSIIPGSDKSISLENNCIEYTVYEIFTSIIRIAFFEL